MAHMKQFVAEVLVVLGCVTTSCVRTTPPVTPASASYHYDFRKGDTRQYGTSENVTAQTGDIKLSIHEGRLKVYDQDYGQLNDGDSVAADESGDVLVNGTLRRPKD